MPLRDEESSAMPYVSIAAQKGALPNTVAGSDLHHEEVTNLLLIAVCATIVLAVLTWLFFKIKAKYFPKQTTTDEQDKAVVFDAINCEDTLLHDESFVGSRSSFSSQIQPGSPSSSGADGLSGRSDSNKT